VIKTKIYSFRQSGRQAITFIGLAVFILLMSIGLSYNAPWYFVFPLGLSGTMLIWAIVVNPKSESDLSPEILSFFHRNMAENIRIADVKDMRVNRWSDGPDNVTLNMRSGKVVHIPSLCADSKLVIALKEIGIQEIA
jgi:hypothetical protein